jgi:hypothetical protein
MKKLLIIGVVAAFALLTNVSAPRAAEPLPYTEGSVFEMTFIRTLQGGYDAYMNSRAERWDLLLMN